MLASLPASAVTDKEMDQARAIAAQGYLRWANDGSGYLDEFSATSMRELEGKLKAKEKENLVAFNSVTVPKDYASWDKAKLVEFWGITFFSSPKLTEKGKGARTRVRQRLQAMTVAAPQSAQTPEVKDEPKTSDPKPTEAEAFAASEAEKAAAAEAETQATEATDAKSAEEDILADQNAISEDAEQKKFKEEESGTWVYVLVLVILIAVVIWLVVFAANMMKKQTPLRAKESGDKNIDTYKSQYETLAAETDRLMSERKRLSARIDELEEKLAETEKQLAAERQRHATAARETAPARESSPAEKREKAANVIYLGRANARGLFVRADRKVIPGSTIFRLDTRDGLVGTFRVVDMPEVVDTALANPMQFLSGGCTADDLEDTDGATHILTDNAGTAMFEEGCWKVLRKSRIRYE